MLYPKSVGWTDSGAYGVNQNGFKFGRLRRTPGSSTRVFYYCRNHSTNPGDCIFQFAGHQYTSAKYGLEQANKR